MNVKLTSLFGNGNFIFDALLKKVQAKSGSNWGDLTGFPISYPTDLTLVKSYRLHHQAFILSVLASLKTGDIYFVTPTIFSSKISWTSASTVDYRDFNDEVSNFVRWGNDNTLWLTLKSDGTTLMQSVIPSS